MGWLFKSKKRKHVIKSEFKDFELGKTELLITFTNNKKATTVVYGQISQFVDNGHDASDDRPVCEPRVGDVVVTTSGVLAKSMLISKKFDAYVEHMILDDPKNPTRQYNGKIQSVKLLKDSSYKERFLVSRLSLNNK